MKKLFIFDLDGTLLDTVPDILYHVNNLFDMFSYPRVTYEQVKQNIGNGLKNLVAKLTKCTNKQKIEKMTRVLIIMYKSNPGEHTIAYNGISNVVKTLHNLGHVTAILSNKAGAVTRELVNLLLKDVPFNEVIGGEDGFKLKPDPEGVNYLLNKYGVQNQNAYIIGDGEADITVGKNANINTISVLWGYRTKEQLLKVGATNFVENVNELTNVLLNQ